MMLYFLLVSGELKWPSFFYFWRYTALFFLSSENHSSYCLSLLASALVAPGKTCAVLCVLDISQEVANTDVSGD